MVDVKPERPLWPRLWLSWHSKLYVVLVFVLAVHRTFHSPARPSDGCNLDLMLYGLDGATIAELGAGVAILSVPHGAVDLALMSTVHSPPRRFGMNLLGYCAVGLAQGLLWFFEPVMGLLLFLLTSIVHFGRMEVDPPHSGAATGAFRTFAHGAVVIVVPVFVYTETCGFLFSLLTGVPMDTMIGSLVAWKGILLGLWAAATLGWMGQVFWCAQVCTQVQVMEVFDVLATAMLCVISPPLESFGVYFCLCHTLRHFLDLAWSERLAAPWSAVRWLVRAALPATVATWVGAYVAYHTIFSSWEVPRLHSAACAPALNMDRRWIGSLRLLFVGLSALAVPHIVLHEYGGGHCVRRAVL